MISKVLYVAAFVAMAWADQAVLPLPLEAVPDLAQASLNCVAKTGIDQDTLRDLINWKIEDTELNRKFVYCFATESGYATKSGHFKSDKMANLLGNHKERNEFKKAVEECNKNKGANEEDTMFKTVKCFLKDSPVIFSLESGLN